VSTLDERRTKRRRKGAAVDDAPPPAVATAPSPAAAATPAEAASAAQPSLDSINFAAYLRHAVSLAPERRAIAAASRTITGDVSWRHLTLRELDEESDALARGFAAAGWSRGQRVLLASEPSADALLVVFALMKMGAVPVVIEPSRPKEEMAACAQQALASTLLASPLGLLKRLHPARPFRGVRNTVLVGAALPVKLPGIVPLKAFRDMTGPRVALASTRPAEPAMILFTSGASAAARPVVLDHAALIAQAESLRRSQGLEDGEVVMCGDLQLALLLAVLGKSVVMPGSQEPSRRDVEKLLRAVDQQRVTTIIGPPPAWRAVAEHCARNGRVLPNVRQIILVGGPASVRTHEALALAVPSGEVRSIYSMTEAFPIAQVSGREALGDARAVAERGGGACIGRPLPGVEVTVLDFGRGGGTPVDPGEVGEIVVRGARVALSDGRSHGMWTRTGDLGWIDRQGRLWLVGRLARTAHSRFGKVYDLAAESLFETHPNVGRCAIVALGQPGQQEAALVIEPAPGRKPKGDPERLEMERELLKIGESSQVTRDVRRVLMRDALPLDARWQAQVRARDLATWINATHG